jgi:adenine deaminase
MAFSIIGNLVDIEQRKIYAAEIVVKEGKILSITAMPELTTTNYILPGFIDAHIHIESSMLVPSEFARLAVVHGTVATVSDPHEIANVCGIEGVEFMISNGNTAPFKFYFGAPSCVPATDFETAGAVIDANGVDELLKREEIAYLSEMMNFPGVLHEDKEVMKKIAAAKKYDKPVDGHAPGLRGEAAKKYIEAGITTDHECFTKEEALDKLQHGMKIIIREGSAAKNFEALVELLNDHPDKIMFCSDDKHPDSLVEGHINQLCARAVAKGIDVFKVLQAACINPVHHYNLKVGLLKEKDAADFIVVKDLEKFEVIQTFINGELVAENGKTKIVRSETANVKRVNNFNCAKKRKEDFVMKRLSTDDKDYSLWFHVDGPDGLQVPVIEALDGQLITNKILASIKDDDEILESNIEEDILKIVVVNRYREAPVAKAFIKNFGLKKGAIASSVAHDSHNIVSVGVDDESICKAVNLIIEHQGGVSCVWPIPDPSQKEGPPAAQSMPVNETALDKNIKKSEALCSSKALPSGKFGWAVLPLPVAGLMSAEDGYVVAEKYAAIDKAAKELGSALSAPFMTLSFMALLVIPHLKLSNLGLFDGDEFKLMNQ